jgi:hypothetical protein
VHDSKSTYIKNINLLKDLTTYGRTKDEWQCENGISCWKWQHENPWIFHEDLPAMAWISETGRSLSETTLLRSRFSNSPRINYHTRLLPSEIAPTISCARSSQFPHLLTCEPSSRTPHLIGIRTLRLARTLDFVPQRRSLQSLYPSDSDLMPGE